MAYRSILVHVDDSARSSERIGLAAALARTLEAHLIGVAPTGVSRFLYPSMPSEQNDPTLALHLGFLREQAHAALAGFTRQCQEGALPSFEGRVIDDEAGGGLCLHGRTADLIVVGQADPDGASLLADLPAYVVLHAGRPVLLTPFAAGCWCRGMPAAKRRARCSWRYRCCRAPSMSRSPCSTPRHRATSWPMRRRPIRAPTWPGTG